VETIYSFNYRHFAEALYQALLPDPFCIAMESSVEGSSMVKREAMLRYMDYSMKEAEKFGELFIPAKHQYGTSIWSKPLSPKLENEKKSNKELFLRTNMGEASLNTYLKITDFMSSQIESVVPSDAWYLSIIGILPEFQGKGLGADLIKPVLTKTDDLKVPTYLETFTPQNKAFYNRLGYQDVASFKEPVTNSMYWVMARGAS
jgi:ribosomal protein S18 acetylase RimI-like enzyme